jgi:hypothetical protein
VEDADYRLWESGHHRFAVTRDGQAFRVLGYVSQRRDKSWRIEHSGKILPSSYGSVAAAARALIALATHEPTSGGPKEAAKP